MVSLYHAIPCQEVNISKAQADAPAFSEFSECAPTECYIIVGDQLSQWPLFVEYWFQLLDDAGSSDETVLAASVSVYCQGGSYPSLLSTRYLTAQSFTAPEPNL